MVRFYRCSICGKIVVVVNDSMSTLVCCNQDMEELVAGKTDASKEKHVPYVKVNGNNITVQVGSDLHPMTAEHFIEWIVLETDKGWQLKRLRKDSTPAADFTIESGEKAVRAYAYCNIHGLWSKEL